MEHNDKQPYITQYALEALLYYIRSQDNNLKSDKIINDSLNGFQCALFIHTGRYMINLKIYMTKMIMILSAFVLRVRKTFKTNYSKWLIHRRFEFCFRDNHELAKFCAFSLHGSSQTHWLGERQRRREAWTGKLLQRACSLFYSRIA